MFKFAGILLCWKGLPVPEGCQGIIAHLDIACKLTAADYLWVIHQCMNLLYDSYCRITYTTVSPKLKWPGSLWSLHLWKFVFSTAAIFDFIPLLTSTSELLLKSIYRFPSWAYSIFVKTENTKTDKLSWNSTILHHFYTIIKVSKTCMYCLKMCMIQSWLQDY